MDSLDNDALKTFVSNLVIRGLGLYGQEEMAKICYDSGIALTDLNEIEWMEKKPTEAVQELLVNYGTRNLPAKMTAIVLARKFKVPVPEALTQKKRNTRQKVKRKIIKRIFKKRI